MKTVFKSDEIPHLWAHGRVDRATCPGNMSIAGPVLLSHGTWIGERLDNGVAVLNGTSYSVSTTQAQSMMRRAIPDGVPTVTVYNVERGDRMFSRYGDTLETVGKRLFESHVERAAHVQAQAAKARQPKKDRLMGLAGEILRDAEKVSILFKLGRKVSQATVDNLVKAKARDEKRRAEALAKAQADRAKKELADLAKWLAGEDVTIYTSGNAFLRLDPSAVGVVETTKGIRLGVDAAALAWRFVAGQRETGWHRNGREFRVTDSGGQSWHLDAVTTEGVVAGCHRFAWPELERFARLMGWMD